MIITSDTGQSLCMLSTIPFDFGCCNAGQEALLLTRCSCSPENTCQPNLSVFWKHLYSFLVPVCILVFPRNTGSTWFHLLMYILSSLSSELSWLQDSDLCPHKRHICLFQGLHLRGSSWMRAIIPEMENQHFTHKISCPLCPSAVDKSIQTRITSEPDNCKKSSL